ncbi:hypothetical protein H5410_044399 [Solanum commersonii]|uniref:F-box associated beta-propeller type 3 domain-containing protein n=1 Tax=Solanum commersonii TaxID=4109 RepID=A0A9J5X8Y1_SOLCO|nr:hypothetical protein H5410_044399 [Solanum commersonii]
MIILKDMAFLHSFCKMSNKGEILFQVDQSTFMIYDPKNDSFICQKVVIDEYPFWEASIYINESLVWPISQKGMKQSGVLRSLRKQTRFEQRMQQPRRWEIPKCVSTQWRCLISSRNFIKTHLNVFTNNKDSIHNRLLLRFIQPHHQLMDCSISSLLYDSDPKTFQLGYPMQNPHKSVMILGSVNGLICLSIEKDLILWNPSIRKFKKFRDPQSSRYFLHGFGYDQLHDDYNLVLISEEVRIYSSNYDSWRTIVHDRRYGLFRERKGIFVNGKLHWANSPSQDEHSYNGWDITSIDVTDGKWGKVEKPFYGEGDFDLIPCVGVLRSDLSILCNNQSLQTDVWIMKEYEIKESWTKMYTINRPHDHPTGYGFSPLFCEMSNKGEILCQVNQSTFMIYDPKNDSFICQKVVIDEYPFWEASIYINESLVWPISPKGIMQSGLLRSLKKQTRFEQQMQQPRRWEIPKCVSTQRCYLISCRNFIKTHLNVFTNNKDSIHNRLLLRFIQPHHQLMDCSISSLLYDSDPKTFQLGYPMQNPRKSVTILGSGLICFSIKNDLILWNPSIRKFKKFRDPQSGHYFLHGFGYDQLHNDYNLGLIFEEVKTYSSNYDSWRTIVHDLSYELYSPYGLFRERKGIFVNGKLHWANSPSQDQHSYNGWDITSIDVTDGKWGKVEKPFYGEGDFDLTSCSLQTDVWIMKEYEIKKSWTKMYTINRPHDHPKGYGFSPLFCKMSNKGEIFIQVDQSTFMIYDPKNESFICQKVIIDEYPFWEASIYINESLVWPISQKGMMQCRVLQSLRKQTRFEQQMQQPQRWEIPK